MPFFRIETNLPKEEIPADFLSKASSLLAKELGKPETYVMIQVNPNQMMTFGGTDEPCANVTLQCIGVVSPEKNRTLAPTLSQFIEDNLKIKQNRFYINIFDIERPYCVWNGKTFG